MSDDDREELRFAVVLNGGVSLAIWMGGAVNEIDRLARGVGAYADMLDWVHSSARIDVISGTSAGGINGAALALSQCNETSTGIAMLRDVWLESGSFARLLRQPFAGSPPSLLQGDEYFLPQLRSAMRRVAEPYLAKPVTSSPMDLSITATLLRGVPGVNVDSAGQRIAENRHDGLFRFQRGPTHRRGANGDDFSDRAVDVRDAEGVVEALALAARTTASYPVAFEPSYLPASDELALASGAERPNMAPYLSGAWDLSQGVKRSRFAVDGGVLANTPTRPALEAIDRMPAEGLVRRVLLLVHPHAAAPGRDADDDPAKPPTLAAVGGSILGALMSEGGRNFASLIEEHNRVTEGRRGVRAEVVKQAAAAGLSKQAVLAYPWYRILRARRAARDLATIWLARPVSAATETERETYAEVYERILAAVLPVLTPDLQRTGSAEQLPAPHLLGFEGALGVADAAVDYLRRAVWTASCERDEGAGGRLATIRGARRRVSQARNDIIRKRETFLATVAEELTSQPTLAQWLTAVASLWGDAPAGAQGVRGSLFGDLQGIATQIAGIRVEPDAAEPGAEALAGFSEALGLGSGSADPAGAGLGDSGPGGTGIAGADPTDVLERLNEIQVMTYVLADEVTTGNSLPIDLIQLTYQVAHPFAPYLTGEDKVAGDMLSRFSAFLKRSWRINDWTWGRLDGARVLCRTVLEPNRVRRCLLARRRGEEAIVETVRREVGLLYASARMAGTDSSPGAAVLPMMPSEDAVVAELTALMAGAHSAQVPAQLVQLPEVFAILASLEIAGDELPELVRATDHDAREGANRRAHGSLNVEAQRAVLDSAANGSATEGWRGLEAFASAGIGRETPATEGSSDQLIATATTTAATAVSLLDSERAGFAALKPVTRTIRGGALLPYWTIRGLTGGGMLARGVSILAFAAGAVLFGLGLLGIGPAWGIAVGAGAILGGFAYGALRSGTVLHGAVLLVPALGLLTWAALELQSDVVTGDGAAGSESGGGGLGQWGVLASIGLLIVGLMILGSLKPPLPSPLKWVDLHRPMLRRVAIGAAITAALLSPPVRTRIGDWVQDAWSWLTTRGPLAWVMEQPELVLAVAGVLVLAVSAREATRIGHSWRLVVKSDVAEGGVPRRAWVQQDVEHPAGVTAGWSWVYGAGLAVLLVVLVVGVLWFAPEQRGETWVTALGVALAVGAVLLAVVVPALTDRSARASHHEQVMAAFSRYPDSAPEDAKIAALFGSGLNLADLISITGEPAADNPWAGLRLSGVADRLWSGSRNA